MTPESQRIAIAEACGWKRRDYVNCHGVNVADWVSRNDVIYGTENLPDYLNDLNAMHEAEKVLTGIQLAEYSIWLQKIEDLDFLATAAQRAEAFLKTLGLWVEEPVSEATVEGLR